MSKKPSLIIARSKRPSPVLVCRKCLKRSYEGRGIKCALKSELKLRSKQRGEKRARVVMTTCFGICPKRAVVVTSAATLQRGEYVLVADGKHVAEALDTLKPT